jgi:hypothetical protein
MAATLPPGVSKDILKKVATNIHGPGDTVRFKL